MDEWPKLDGNLIKPLQFWWSELASDHKMSLEEKILLLVQSPNSVSNCLHDLAGNLLYEHLKERDMFDDSTMCFEELEEAFQDLHYVTVPTVALLWNLMPATRGITDNYCIMYMFCRGGKVHI